MGKKIIHKEVDLEYIEAKEMWLDINEQLLNMCLDSLKIPHTWISGTLMLPGESLDKRIRNHVKGALWLHYNLSINNIIAIRTMQNDFTTHTEIINISSQQIIHDVQRVLNLKVFL